MEPVPFCIKSTFEAAKKNRTIPDEVHARMMMLVGYPNEHHLSTFFGGQMALRAIVIGTGWAGEGHVLGLRHGGADVIALCGRTPEPAKEKASKLGIDTLSFDWRQAIRELKPDIVSIATPAAPRREMAEFAVKQGCHVICEKPLAANAEDARAMLKAAANAGVLNGYTPVGALYPKFSFIKSLVEEGKIGSVRHVEWIGHTIPRADAPFGWTHCLADGGGELNLGFTHIFQIIVRISSARVVAAGGTATRIIQKAPVGVIHHDLRDAKADSVDITRSDIKWQESDGDDVFSVLLRLQQADLSGATATVEFAYGRDRKSGYIAIHGTDASLETDFWGEQVWIGRGDNDWQALEIPQSFYEDDGQGDRNQKAWNRFFAQFVRDVEGKPSGDYPTFHDGWIACQVIDAVRNESGMQPISYV